MNCASLIYCVIHTLGTACRFPNDSDQHMLALRPVICTRTIAVRMILLGIYAFEVAIDYLVDRRAKLVKRLNMVVGFNLWHG